MIFLGLVAAFLFIMFLLGLKNTKDDEKRFRDKCKKEYGEAPHKRLLSSNKRLSAYHEKHADDFSIDDITWNDLSMEDVFNRINYCESSSGEEYLYYMLRNPLHMNDSDYSLLEKELEGLSSNEDERIALKSIFHKIGKNNKYSIYDYLDLLDKNNEGSNISHILVIVLMVASLIFAAFVNFTVGFIIFLGLLAYNIVSYFRIRAAIEPYLVTFTYVCRLIYNAKELIAGNISTFSDEKNKLTEYVEKLSGFARGSFIVMSASRMSGSGNPLDMLADYIRMITHVDLIKFNNMFKKLNAERESVDNIITIMGRMDALCSLCYYRASLNNGYCKPEFTSDGDETFLIEDGYHPLLTSPVVNSVNLNKGILLTGSNASGKSTFLKMCAINAIFAEGIHTCLSRKYKAKRYRIYSSMALKDDITDGDSYYMVEIKSLKRILDAAEGKGAPVICFIDEVLRGTNTVERISASTKVLEHFADSDVCCFAATHDMELAELLAGKYEIDHFEGIMEGDDVKFDYKLKSGPALTRNAIKLLGKIGYDESLVEEAENMAQAFQEKGVWTL